MRIEKDWIFVNLSRDQAEHMGAVWNAKAGCFRLPNTIGVLKELYLMGELNGEGKEYLQQKIKHQNYFFQFKYRENAPGDERLRPYQRVDVDYLKRLPSAGIFNEQRTGKTPTTLVMAQEKELEHILIVVPASLVINWKEEVEKWTNLKTIVALGTKSKRKEYYGQWLTNKGTLITSYESLRNDLNELQKNLTEFDAMIIDEAHRIKSYNVQKGKGSQISKAVMQISRYAKHRYALTGTPVTKSGEEIWAILHFLYPERFPGKWQFIDRYFETTSNGFGVEIGGYKRKNELQDMIALISVNRKRKEVMPWLPKKQYQTIKLEMNDKQKKVYESVRDTFEYEDVIDAPSVLAQLTRLRQIATCPEILVEKVPNEKEKFILEWIKDNPNESVVIFSTFSSYLKQLQKKIKGSRLITGEISKEDRDKTVKSFQAGKTKVILANIKAAGTGLTLDKGETVIFLDKEFNPSDNEQAEDRIVPTSKERNHSMTVISLVMKDTADEMINGLLKHKINITKVINDGGIQALQRKWKELSGER